MDITEIISGINRKLETAGLKKLETQPTDNFPAMYLTDWEETTERYVKTPPTYTANPMIKINYIDRFDSEDSFNAISSQVKKLISTLNYAEDILIAPKELKIVYKKSEMDLLYEEESRQTFASWTVSFQMEQVNATD